MFNHVFSLILFANGVGVGQDRRDSWLASIKIQADQHAIPSCTGKESHGQVACSDKELRASGLDGICGGIFQSRDGIHHDFLSRWARSASS